MKIDNYYSATNDGLYIYIPIRFYELKLKHRLLEQLGGFSLLLLDAITLLPERGIEWALELTGLKLQQLQPILNRLNGLDLINGGQLTERGTKLTAWKRLLHDQTRYVWLDGNHKSHSFCGDASLNVMELHEDAPFVIRHWHQGNDKPRSWSCQDWNEDCERQKNRILRYPTEYLGAVFETFQNCFSNTRFNFNVHEWELNVRYVPDSPELAVLKVQLDPAGLRPGSTDDFVVASPVLCLDTCYRLPNGAPIELRNLQPEDQRRTMSFGFAAAAGTELLLDPPANSWVWPEVDEPVRRQAVNLLFQNVAVSAPQAEALFNRDHNLAELWQSFGFDWSTVEGSLQEVKGVHRIKGDT